jgi:hypothetical protein
MMGTNVGLASLKPNFFPLFFFLGLEQHGNKKSLEERMVIQWSFILGFTYFTYSQFLSWHKLLLPLMTLDQDKDDFCA